MFLVIPHTYLGPLGPMRPNNAIKCHRLVFVNNGFDNGLSRVQYQVITWTNIDLLSIKLLQTTSSEI